MISLVAAMLAVWTRAIELDTERCMEMVGPDAAESRRAGFPERDPPLTPVG